MPSSPSSTQTPSRRWSPRRLSPSLHSADAGQMTSAPSFSHDPSVSYDNYNVGGYPSNVQGIQTGLLLTVEPSHVYSDSRSVHYYHQATSSSSSSYPTNGSYSHAPLSPYAGPANAGPYQDVYTSNSVAEAATSSRHSFPAHPSSHHQTYSVVKTHAAASSSHVSRSSSMHTSNKQPAASSSRRQSEKEEIKAKMRPMQTRMRLPPVNPAHAESTPLPSSIAEKRKDRSPSPSAPEGSQPEPKKTKSSSKAAVKAATARDKRNSDLAELASRLPPALYLSEDVPTTRNIRRAITHIDQQQAEIERLQSEVNRLTFEAAHQTHMHHEEMQRAHSQIVELTTKELDNQSQITALRAEYDAKIEALETELQQWRSYYQRQL